MITSTLKVLSDCRQQFPKMGQIVSAPFMAFTLKAIFVFGLTVYSAHGFAEKSLKVAILDTGFCPSLAFKNPNIQIESVIDVTQSNIYKCVTTTLDHPRFHGQKVLDLFSYTYPKSKTAMKLIITTVVVFNNQGVTQMSYWRQAIKLTGNHDFIISAAGFKLPTDTKSMHALLKKTPPLTPITLLTSGRIAPSMPKGTKLFPQELHFQENIFLIGSYHQALFKNGTPLKDKGLFYKKHISYFFEYSGQFQAKLTGASRALAIGSSTILGLCAKKSQGQIKKLEKCMQEKREEIPYKAVAPKPYTLKKD